MIALKEVQAAAAAILTAWPYFAGQTIVTDTGNGHAAEAVALRDATKGQCIIVLPLLDGNTVSQGGGSAVVTVGIGIRIATNPETKTKDIYELMTEAKKALLESPGNNNERFKLDAKAFNVDDLDPGVLAYHVFFTKLCTF